jgi:hypothetical protein
MGDPIGLALRKLNRTKHIDVKFHLVKERIQTGQLELVFCPTNTMLADSFTKPSTVSKSKIFCDNINLLTLKQDEKHVDLV